MIINVGTFVDLVHMDTQLQELMDLALRWSAILYLKKVDQLPSLFAGSGLLFHRLGSFRGLEALSVDGFDSSWTEFTKFVPMFRLIFETEDLSKTQLWAIWMRYLDQM